MGRFTEFGEAKACKCPVCGYVILGHRADRYFDMYGEESDVLFTEERDGLELMSGNDGFIMFMDEMEGSRDMHDLQKCCYNEDMGLEMCLCRCEVLEGTEMREGRFVGNGAVKAGKMRFREVVERSRAK